MKVRWIILVLALWGTISLQSQDDRAEQFLTHLRQLQQEDDLTGNILIAEGGEVIFEAHLGLASATTKDTLGPNAVFELASVSKQFTAAAILLLQRQGKLQLQDPLAKYIPELHFYNGITIDHLVHHTSGLPDYMDLFETHWDHSQMATNAAIIQRFAELQPPALFAPGEEVKYSNTGYALLGSIIEKMSGQRVKLELLADTPEVFVLQGFSPAVQLVFQASDTAEPMQAVRLVQEATNIDSFFIRQ